MISNKLFNKSLISPARVKYYATLVFLLMGATIPSFAQTDFAKIITNVTTLQKSVGSPNSAVAANMAKLDINGKFTDLAYSTVPNAVDDNIWTTHLTRLNQFALAYTITTSAGSNYYGDVTLYNKIVLALKYFNSNGINYTNNNWWLRDIGNPLIVGQILILMRGGLSTLPSADETAAITYMAGAHNGNSPAGTGANLTDEALHCIYRAALTSNVTLLNKAIPAAASTLTLATSGSDGINYDYDFLFHFSQVYAQGYGAVLLTDIYGIANILIGTSYGFSAAALNTAYNFMHNSYYGAARGKYADFGLVGRGLSRSGANGSIGSSIASQALKVDTNPAHAANIRADIANSNSGTISSSNSFVSPKHTHYWTGDYTLHNRPGYQFTVRSVSTRTHRSEGDINGENLLGKFLSDGATNIRVNGDEYYQIFPVWDWNQIPGITMRQYATPQPNTNRFQWTTGSTKFVGGVSDSTYGASTYQLNFVSVVANKSWFFFDDEVVCLGAGITSTAAEVVATNVNQTLLKGAVSINNGATSTAATHSTTNYPGTLKWAWHNSVGYFFPQGGDVTLSTQSQTGSWANINSTQSSAIVNTDVFKMFLSHGASPVNKTYSYIVVPGITAATAASYDVSNIKILSNTALIQAVKHEKLKILQVIFTAAGSVTDPTSKLKVTVDKPCALMIKNVSTAGKVAITVADPSQSTATINVTIVQPGKATSVTPFITPTGNYKGSSGSFRVAGTLPVELTSFNATAKTDYVDVTWATASELNNDYFLVQSSKDLETWRDVGQVSGHGTTSVSHTYELKDNSPSGGTSYYRLKQVDFNGNDQLSEIKTINIKGIIQLYPNPTIDKHVKVEIPNPGSIISISIYNLVGYKVYATVLTSPSDETLIADLELGNLTAGEYIVRIVNGDVLTYRKIIVQ